MGKPKWWMLIVAFVLAIATAFWGSLVFILSGLTYGVSYERAIAQTIAAVLIPAAVTFFVLLFFFLDFQSNTRSLLYSLSIILFIGIVTVLFIWPVLF